MHNSKPWGNSKGARKRRQVAARDGWQCHYCGIVLTAYNATLDHKLPRSCGGTWSIENAVLSCKECNETKANMTYDAFINSRKLEIIRYWRALKVYAKGQENAEKQTET